MISFGLDEEQQLLQETIRTFAAQRLRPRLRELEKARAVAPDVRAAFDELGLGLLDVPEAHGGAGLSQVAAAIVHEELAWGDAGAAVALLATFPATAALLELGDPAQRQAHLAKLARPGASAQVAFSEPGKPGATLFSTVARRDGDSWTLTGRKTAVLHDAGELTIVFASIEGGVAGGGAGAGGGGGADAGTGTDWQGAGAFVVARGNPGLRVGARADVLGLRTARIGELVLEGCRVPGDGRLTGGGDFAAAARRFFARYGLVTAARQVGLARAAYEYARGYAEQRSAFGKPIAHFQEIAFRLADMHMDVESARHLVWRAAAEWDAGAPGALASIAKAATHAAEAAWRVADWSVQILGGAGYMADHPCEKWMRDTKALALCGPTAEAWTEALAALELGDAPGELASPHVQPIVT